MKTLPRNKIGPQHLFCYQIYKKKCKYDKSCLHAVTRQPVESLGSNWSQPKLDHHIIPPETPVYYLYTLLFVGIK